jgi:hypothetical protein
MEGEDPEMPATDRLTGWSGSAQHFRFDEVEGLRAEAVVAVLRGQVAGVVFRNLVPAGICAELARRFWSSSDRQQRGEEAPGYYLGAYHYHKTVGAYLDDCEATRRAVEEVLDLPGDPLDELHQGLSKALAQEGVEFRLARHAGRSANRAILRSWHGQNRFALAPHEDLGQCTEPRQAEFEIQRTVGHTITALNMCLENGEHGELVLWNLVPDEATRHRLGLHHTGSPYPLELLDEVESVRLPVSPGDVYLFNGAHIHAVEPESDPQARRLTLSAILGFVDERTVVSWT